MWDIPRLYVSACSNSCQLVPLHPIIISILFHHYKELKECISEFEQIEEASRATDSKKKDWSTMKRKEEQEEEEIQDKKEEEKMPTTLDGYFIQNNANYK